MITWLDYTLLAILLLLVPVHGSYCYRQLRERLAAGVPGVRLKSYRATIIYQWSSLGVVLAVWLWAGRTPETLGLLPASDLRFWIGCGLVLAVVAALVWQERRLRRRPEAREQLRHQCQSVRDMLPQTRQELRAFSQLSITAGICEEIVYRGYLMWLFGLWFAGSSAGTWLAVLGSTIIFTLGHSYQGASNMVRVFLLGLVMAALYVLTGSLWAPIFLHAAIDFLQGRIIYWALAESSELPPALETA